MFTPTSTPAGTRTRPAYGPLTRGRAPLIELDGVVRAFRGGDGEPLTVLDGVSLTLHDGEIVALLGRSGCGKSTLLRVLAGLTAPTAGTVRYRGGPVRGANPGVAMVFQSFALMPWLDVLGNVELGLADVPLAERRRRALDAIDAVGLDGFESAYPRELSGGMRQRTGFARALVREPDVLLMDEPFSALDVLTAENLRAELLELWSAGSFATRAICLVTHNIEEALLLADRVLVLDGGRITAELAVPWPRPRDRDSAAFRALADDAYRALAGDRRTARRAASPANAPLPDAPVGAIAGLTEMLAARDGVADLAHLAAELSFEARDLVPVVDAARLLGLVLLDGATLRLTRVGYRWTRSDIRSSKVVFARLALERVPLVHAVTRALEATGDGRLPEEFLLATLRRGMTAGQARRQLDTAVDWGRYGELFEYDADGRELYLPRA